MRGKSSDGLSTKNHLSSPHTPGYTYNCKHELYETLNVSSDVFTAKHWLGSGLFSDGSYVMVVGF